MSGEDLGADWGADAEPSAPASRRPPEDWKASARPKGGVRPSGNVPTWQEAIFPSLSKSSGNPMQDIGAFGAGLKDLAALPVNALAGLVNTLNTPINKGEAFRRGAAGVEPGAMSQNQRAVASLGLLPGYAAGRLASAVIPASTAAAPLARGLANLGRAGAVGAAESTPASLAQFAMGDNAGAIGGLALGGALGAGVKAAGMGLRGLGKTTGNVAESMTGVPASDLRKIGFLGNSEYGQKVLAVAENRRQHLNDLGDAFLDRVRNFDQYLPNAGEIDQIISDLPEVKVKGVISALERAKTAIKIPGKKGSVSEGTAEVFSSPRQAAREGAQARGGEVFQEMAQIEGPKEVVPFSNIARGGRPATAGAIGFDEKGPPAIRRNPQVIPDAEPIGEAGYSVYKKGEKGRKISAVPEDRASDAKINEVINILKQASDENGYIPASALREIRKRYDRVIVDVSGFGKESSAYINALKNGRHEIAKALEEAATESGKPEYAAAMKDYATKLDALDDVMGKLGGDKKTQEDRIEGYLSNLFQGNKTNQQEAFKRLSDIMGADFAEKAQLLSDAKRIAPTGSIPLISAHKTGKAGLGGGVLGVGYGVASGNPVLAGTSLLGAALGSPALSPGLISVADRVSSMAARPMAGRLARTAGRTGRALLQAETTER